MTDAPAYLQTVEDRLRTGGYQVEMHAIGGWPTLTGYRSDVKLQWMGSKLHLFVCVRAVPVVTAELLEGFNKAALEYTKSAKGAMRGAQSGVAAIGVLVGDTVEPDAVEYARKQLVRNFAAFAWPVAVDLATGERTSHHGRPTIGAVFTGWMRKQIEVALPTADPATAVVGG